MIYTAPDEWQETFVVTNVDLKDAAQLGAQATTWLVQRGVIEEAQWYSVMEPIGHAFGPNAAEACEGEIDRSQLGLVEIWSSGEGIIVMGKIGPIIAHCPQCRARQGFRAAVLDQWEKQASASNECNSCRGISELDDWDGGPDFAFARLTITFNHCPRIKESFKRQLIQALGDRTIRTIFARG